MRTLFIGMVIAVLATVSAPALHAQPYTFRFFNHTTYTDSDIQILAFATPAGTNVNNMTYTNSTQLSVSNSVPLSAFTPGGVGGRDLTVGYANSLQLLIGLGAPQVTSALIASNGTPSFTGGPTVPWATNNYGGFEATVIGVNDNANGTAINSVGVPLQLKGYAGTTNVANVGFTNPAALPALRSALQSQMPSAAWPNATSPIRYVGPNVVSGGSLAVPGGSGYMPNFASYVGSVGAVTNNAALIQSQVSYKVNDQTNWAFNYFFTNTVTSSNSIALTGSIVYSNSVGTGNTVYTNSGLGATIIGDVNGTNDAFLSSYIYAAPASLGGATSFATNNPAYTNSPVGQNKITFTGDWQGLTNATGLDYFSIISPKVEDRILGDVAFGFAYGFIGSETIDPNTSNTFGSEASFLWYATNQTLVFDALQSNNTFYSEYSKAIYDASSSMYSHPYSDRMAAPAFDPSVQLNNSTNLLEIHIYDFVIPEPATAALITFGVIAFAAFKTARRKA